MGSYLSEPIVEKESSDCQGKLVDCGASSMQGWRVTQEDAHNTLLDFDTDTSFFAVYDGHGGNEVAVYCEANLPQFLKECEHYKKADFVAALRETFLGFDAKLATPEVVAVLKEIVGNKDGGPNSVSDDDEDTVRNLYEEAEMPLEQVMARYSMEGKPTLKKLSGEGGFKSPMIRGKRACASGASGSGTSAGKSFVPALEDEVSSSDNSAGQSSSPVAKKNSPREGVAAESDVKNVNGDAEVEAEPLAEPKNGVSEPENSVQEKKKEVVTVQDKEEKKTDIKPDSIGVAPVKKVETNGGVGDGDVIAKVPSEPGDDVTSVSVPHENGEVAPYKGKGKGKAKVATELSSLSVTAGLRRLAASVMYKSILEAGEEGSDSDSDSDENFEAVPSSSDNDDDDDDEAEGDADNDEDEDDDEEDEDVDGCGIEDEEDDEEDEEEDSDFTMKMTEEPGYDSGCTAVVALLRGRELYVANAGDSRCVVCRKGEAVDMSSDHKPEDQAEMDRIIKAGGKVTADGRVNGGLNLSRALGDHAYKLNSELPPEEQMITALPDVRTLTIDPADDEFMVLACDGIWNFMSSQEVCDFVRPRLQEGKEKLSTICEELFDHCLAPNTLGDGTGCDNMTALIVKFHPTLATITIDNKSAKRPASTPGEEDETVKRAKTDESLPV